MAIDILSKDGYGQLELNQVAWRRDGRIEAQCALDSTEFASVPAENAMLLAVDNVARVVKKATPTLAATLPVGIHYSTEHMYDERALGLKYFSLPKGSFLPRIGYLATGDIFTTNLVAYDTTDFTDEETLVTALGKINTTPIYGGLNADADAAGLITLTKNEAAFGPIFRVVEKTTMPDGQLAVKLQVTHAYKYEKGGA